MKVHVDRSVPDGNAWKIGPFKVKQQDCGLMVTGVGRKKKQQTIVYRELFEVRAYGKVFAALAEVNRLYAEFGHKGGMAAARMEMALRVLNDLRKKIEREARKQRAS